MVVDVVHFDLVLLLRSVSCLDMFLPALDSTHVSTFVPSRSPTQPGSSFLSSGISHLGVLLLIVNLAQFGPASALRSFTRLGFASSASDPAHADLSPISRSPACFGVAVTVTDLTHIESIVLSRFCTHLGLASSSFGIGRIDALLPVVDPAEFNVAATLRSPT